MPRSPRAAFFAGSRRLPSELLGFALPAVTADQCAFLAAELARNGCLADDDAPAPDDPARQLCTLAIGAHAALLREAGFHFPECAELVDPPDGANCGVAIPKIVCGSDLSAELLQRLVRLCAQTALQRAPADGWVEALRREIARVPVPIVAAAHMARAAYELGLPILELHSVFIQVGHGRRGAALTGSITEHTSSIGVHFAREKNKANALLARAGFPVAEGGTVRDLAEARERAAALGYPVVVKPADRDGGLAVTTDIRDPADLANAYQKARAASPRVIVEKHVEGTDYRLLFHGDELLVVLERTPGGITGNGRDAVSSLLDALNREREGTPLNAIALDAEARDMLERQGLSPDSVPAKGRFVRLRRAANHALGGAVRRIDDIHPDNVDLARRAMRLVRLDLAGLDLLLPDVTRSWRETGGAICEINAQPYIGEVVGRDLYKAILEKLVPDGGRIPLVLTLGSVDPKTIAALEKRVPGLAVVDRNGARRGGHPLSAAGATWAQACQAALYDRETAAALYVLAEREPVPATSPADRFSAAFVLEPPPEGSEPLLRRADAIHALEGAQTPLRRAGFKFKAIQRAGLADALAGALSGVANPPAARAKSARRGTAPPAPRKRR